MAQLPPEIPNMAAPWPEIIFSDVCYQKLPIPSQFTENGCGGGGAQARSWVDEFLDFSAARRGAHRRSTSDAVAFIDSGNHSGGVRSSAVRGDFDKFDDGQFLSIFTDEISPVGHTPSTPSNQNSGNDEKQVQEKGDHHPPPPQQQTTEDIQSPCNSLEVPGTFTAGGSDSGEKIVDPKRVKRILANRQSAQRSRVRKLQYISELERSVTSLQAEVSVLSPRVAFLDRQRLLLTVDNSAIKQRIAALSQDKICKDAQQEALKRETQRLREVYHQQKNMENNNNGYGNGNSSKTLPDPNPICQVEKEQLLVA